MSVAEQSMVLDKLQREADEEEKALADQLRELTAVVSKSQATYYRQIEEEQQRVAKWTEKNAQLRTRMEQQEAAHLSQLQGQSGPISKRQKSLAHRAQYYVLRWDCLMASNNATAVF